MNNSNLFFFSKKKKKSGPFLPGRQSKAESGGQVEREYSGQISHLVYNLEYGNGPAASEFPAD